MTQSRQLSIGALVFEGYELLDLYGPLEMFSLLEGAATIEVVAREAGPVASSGGVRALATAALRERSGYDLLLVPGGSGTRSLSRDAAFLGELRRVAEGSSLVASVCTGSLLLAACGLLNGVPATTNKRVFATIRAAFPKVLWQGRARWVDSGKFVTASGISAGTDMALALVARLYGEARAEEIAKRAEYRWSNNPEDDPFAAE
jgi:transcriptional regulator GlxA family with amidase domain